MLPLEDPPLSLRSCDAEREPPSWASCCVSSSVLLNVKFSGSTAGSTFCAFCRVSFSTLPCAELPCSCAGSSACNLFLLQVSAVFRSAVLAICPGSTVCAPCSLWSSEVLRGVPLGLGAAEESCACNTVHALMPSDLCAAFGSSTWLAACRVLRAASAGCASSRGLG